MNANNELLDKLKQFLSDDEIKEGIEKGVIKLDIEKMDEASMNRMPYTSKTPGLESGTGAINQTMADGASWEMVKTTIMKAIEGFEKATEMLSSYMEKAEYKEDQDKDMEKAYGKMMGSADEMKKQMKMYKGKMNMNKADMDKKDMEKGTYTGQGSAQVGQGSAQVGQGSGQMNKAENDFLEKIEKSFNEKIGSLSTKNEELLNANNNLSSQNQTLEKSIASLNDQLGQIKADMDKIGNETPAPKSVNYQAYIEKGGVKDEEGKKIYHVGIHKSQIINELEKAKAGLEDLEKARVDDDILNYSSAGIAPSEETARLLHDKYNVKLVK